MPKYYMTYLNPLRFRNVKTTEFYSIDDMALSTQYQKGIYSNEKYTQVFLYGETLYLQVRSEYSMFYTQYRPLIRQPNGVTVPMGYANVTPAGYSMYINLLYFNVNQLGRYYIYSNWSEFDNQISCVFYSVQNNNDLIEIEYTDTKNDHNGYFYDSSSNNRWAPKTYFRGTIMPGEPKNEYSIYKNDPGTPERLRANPQNTIDLHISDVSNLHLEQLNAIFSCDTLKVNGTYVLNEENFTIDKKDEKSDLVDVTINLTLISDGFLKYS